MLRRALAPLALLPLLVAGCGSAAPAAATSPSAVTVTVTATSAATSAVPGTTTKPTSVTATVAPTTKTVPAAPSASAASFAAFTGQWVGHTRMVTVSTTGLLVEHVGDGCCDPVIDLVLQLSDPHRKGGTWVASSRVVSATPHKGWKGTGRPAPKPGDTGTVTVGADHVLVDSITDNGFCDQDKTAPGTCGA